MNDLVSLCVPVYNTEKYLCDCIESIQKQSYSNIEVLFNDDGSTDSSYEILQEYAKLDNRFRVNKSSNRGPAGARNLLINNVKGKYVLFVDSDDVIDKDYVQDFVSNTKEFSLTICGMSVDYINEGKSIKTSFNSNKSVSLSDKIFHLDKLGLLYSPCNKLYDKEVIYKYNLRFNESLENCEDLDFNVRYLKYINDIIIIPKSNYHYRKFDVISDVNSFRKDIVRVALDGISLKNELYDYFRLDNKEQRLFLLSTNVDVLNYCLINAITYSRLRNREGVLYIIEFVNNQTNSFDYINEFVPNNLFQSIFMFCYRTNNTYFTFVVYKILLLLRYTFKGIYGLFRKKYLGI